MTKEVVTVDQDGKDRGKFLFRLGLADVLRLTMFGTLIAVILDITRLPLHLPGHTSIVWMGILVLGVGLIPKFGAGMIMGFVSGVLAVLLGMQDNGVLVFFWYFLPGLLLDLLNLFFGGRLENPVVGAICGMLASLAKLFTALATGLLLRLPIGFLAVGLGFVAVCHVMFGAAGGILAAFLTGRLKPRLTTWE